ncbi:hypothetical protein Tco_0840354 [Tanacetum coccineum]|uniref:Uncharacterized protein n=1 Tax=Tanacetum coccineum TaxID=301880 RepID=A0ABQ5AWB2_9ASTR
MGIRYDLFSSLRFPYGSSILKEVQVLKSSGFDFLSYCSKRIGDGHSTSFWKETWMGDIPLCELCPRDQLGGGGEQQRILRFKCDRFSLAFVDLVLPSF